MIAADPAALSVGREAIRPRSRIRPNHFDLLRSLQDGFALSPLGYAARREITGLPLDEVLKAPGP